jgi:hypothetical protein
VLVLPLGKFQAASPAAEHHRNTPPFVGGQGFQVQFRVVDGLPRSIYRQRRAAGNVRAFLGMEILIRIDSAHFAGNLNGKLGRIESGDAPYSALPCPETVPQLITGMTERGHTAEAADNNAVGTGISAAQEWHAQIIHRTAKVVTV